MSASPTVALPVAARCRRMLILIALLLVPSLPIAADVSMIEYLEGDVQVESQGSRRTADFGTPLSRGDLVITGEDGVAIVRVSASSQIKLRENTVVSIDDVAGGGSVDLRRGGLFARAHRAATGRGFQVTTPTVVAGVRGTDFFVAYGRMIEERPDLWLCVNSGSVEVLIPQTGDLTVVNEGEGVNILAGLRTTQPRFYPWTLELNWSFDPDEGDVRDTTDLDGAYADLLDQDYD